MKGERFKNKLLQKQLKSIVKDPAYVEMYESFQAAKHELTKIRTVSNRRFRNILGINLKEALLLQRNIIGAYVRRSMIKSNQIIRKSFKDMSYIN